MARARLTFRERDVTAAIKAAKKALGDTTGHTVRVAIQKDGSIIVELAPPRTNETAPEPENNPFDKVFNEDYEP